MYNYQLKHKSRIITDTIFSEDTMCLHRPIDVKYKLTHELEVAARAHPDYPGGGGEKNTIINAYV